MIFKKNEVKKLVGELNPGKSEGAWIIWAMVAFAIAGAVYCYVTKSCLPYEDYIDQIAGM